MTPNRLNSEELQTLDAQARLQSDGTTLVFKQLARSCRRWQL